MGTSGKRKQAPREGRAGRGAARTAHCAADTRGTEAHLRHRARPLPAGSEGKNSARRQLPANPSAHGTGASRGPPGSSPRLRAAASRTALVQTLQPSRTAHSRPATAQRCRCRWSPTTSVHVVTLAEKARQVVDEEPDQAVLVLALRDAAPSATCPPARGPPRGDGCACRCRMNCQTRARRWQRWPE
jgi:hypothetical protein